MTNPRFSLTLEAAPQANDPRGQRRLRVALKTLLRRFGLRCLSCHAVDHRPQSLDELLDQMERQDREFWRSLEGDQSRC